MTGDKFQSVPVDKGIGESETVASKPARVTFLGFLTSLVVFNSLLLEVLEDIGPKLLLQTVAVVPEQTFQTIPATRRTREGVGETESSQTKDAKHAVLPAKGSYL